MEIERKFLVKTLPVIKDFPSKYIVQAYVSTDPVIRIRQLEDSYFLTIKSQGHLVREEFELPITKTQYDHLYLKIENQPIVKKRYYIPISDQLTAELDIYHKSLEGLYTVEVEFPSIEDANRFSPPEWFGKDISLDHRYKNNNLAKYGLPK